MSPPKLSHWAGSRQASGQTSNSPLCWQRPPRATQICPQAPSSLAPSKSWWGPQVPHVPHIWEQQ